MKRFERYTETIPTESNPTLANVEKKFGFVPNLLRGLAASPQALESYIALDKVFGATTLTPEEQQVVLLTASRYNECEYCTSAHSTMAESTDLPWETIEAVRNRETVSNARYEALRGFTERVIEHNGRVPHDEWTEFTEAGFDERTALEVTVGVAFKTLTNTANHLMDTPLDDQFKSRAWTRDIKERGVGTASPIGATAKAKAKAKADATMTTTD